MSTTAFVNNVTLTDAAWFNDVDTATYQHLTAVAGTNTITATGPVSCGAWSTGLMFRFVPANTNTGATTINPSCNSVPLGAKNIFVNGVACVGGELKAGVPVIIVYDGTRCHAVTAPVASNSQTCQFRLTLTTGVPVTTADVNAAETLYWTPYKGNQVALYDGAAWNIRTSAEISIDVPDATNCYDVFVYDNAGVATLELTAWTNETTRATALTTQDGVLVKTGALTRRYVGTFYCTTAGNGQIEDTYGERNLWNYYNRVQRPMRVIEATNSWSYATATIRQANASTANQLNFVIGVSEDTVGARVNAIFANNTANGGGTTAIGLDSTTAAATGCLIAYQTDSTADSRVVNHSTWTGFPGVGKHYLSWLEAGNATGTQSWLGDDGAATLRQSGIHGELVG